jgi:L-ribulokinase
VAASGVDPADVVAIGTDFTACTMIPCLADGTPLSEVEGLADRPHAYVKLWKHHAAQEQADRITRLAAARGEPWLPRYGGIVSSEWQLAKGLQLFEEDRELYDLMDRWVEAADWIVWQLSGCCVRSAGAAGYKGLHQDGEDPSPDFLGRLAPGFGSFVADKVDAPVRELGSRAGPLTAQAAAWTGLREGIPVAVGNVDAHVTAPAARAVGPGQMVMILGTSMCQVVSADALREVPGMSGAVHGGVVGGLWGYEAGQSGGGDILDWFIRSSVPASYAAAAGEAGRSLHEHLTLLAAGQEVGEHGLLALDWHSGNRSVLVDAELSGQVLGLTLATKPEDIYRALLEALAFGSRVIVDGLRASGVPVDEIVVAGGLAKNALVLRIYADVLRMPLSVIGSGEAAALGSAIQAAVAAGAYPDLPAAASAMGRTRPDVWVPDEARADAYEVLFREYRALHDHFGRGTPTMRRLRAMRRDALARRHASSPADASEQQGGRVGSAS